MNILLSRFLSSPEFPEGCWTNTPSAPMLTTFKKLQIKKQWRPPMTYQKKPVSPDDTQRPQTQQQQGEISSPRSSKPSSPMSYQLGFTSGPAG
jgi:hypothetical protein